ncbi:MAG: hypothetical protein K6G81_03825 [Lachnospiraceae bacterium]|nr:hypothetical protein [Lachnospiraceae bacterium]
MKTKPTLTRNEAVIERKENTSMTKPLVNNPDNLISKSNEGIKKREYKVKTIPLNGDRRLIHRVKKAGLKTYNPRGAWTRFGYERLPMVVEINSVGEMRKFNKIKKELEDVPRRPPKTLDQEIASWARRLIKLLGDDYDLTQEEAEKIAREKLEYQQEKINGLNERQDEHYSARRERLIDKMYRENPLRYIKDEYHALNILHAHERHTDTCYDDFLDRAHELEEDGVIERGTAKDLARSLLDVSSDEAYTVLWKLSE